MASYTFPSDLQSPGAKPHASIKHAALIKIQAVAWGPSGPSDGRLELRVEEAECIGERDSLGPNLRQELHDLRIDRIQRRRRRGADKVAEILRDLDEALQHEEVDLFCERRIARSIARSNIGHSSLARSHGA